MASTMLHYVIASIIAEKMNMDNAGQFLIGALLPDASAHEDKSYDKAHFMKANETKKGFGWQEFKNKYYNEIQTNPFYKGYMCHIIMDAVWFCEIVDKYVRIYPRTVRQEYYKKVYRDYWKMNDILPKKYGVSKPQIDVPEIHIEEIHHSLIPNILDGLQQQFDIQESYEPDDLEFIPYEAIREYIAKSVEMCIGELTHVSVKECYFNPKDMYVNK